MEIKFDKFNIIKKRVLTNDDIYSIDTLVTAEWFEKYLTGSLDTNVLLVEYFDGLNESLKEIDYDLYIETIEEIKLNIVLIETENQLKRYLKYLKAELSDLIDFVRDWSEWDYIESLEKPYLIPDVSRIEPKADPVSTLLFNISELLYKYSSMLVFVEGALIELGLEVINDVATRSKLTFKGQAGDFIELITALIEGGSIQRIDGEKLTRTQAIKDFKVLFNITDTNVFDENTLSKRLSDRKKAVSDKSLFTYSLLSSFKTYSKKP